MNLHHRHRHFFLTSPTTAFRETSIYTDHPRTFHDNVEYLVDIGACSSRSLLQVHISFETVFSKLHWHTVNIRMDDFLVSRAAFCNFQCVILRAPETDKIIMAVVAGLFEMRGRADYDASGV